MLLYNVQDLSFCVQGFFKFGLISKFWIIQTIWTLISWEKKQVIPQDMGQINSFDNRTHHKPSV